MKKLLIASLVLVFLGRDSRGADSCPVVRRPRLGRRRADRHRREEGESMTIISRRATSSSI